jgi:Protein of unknown function (DUF2848)
MNHDEALTSQLSLTCIKGRESRSIEIHTEHLIVAGWTGTDAEVLERHIQELELLGIARPRETPMFYQVSASLLTAEASIQVLGMDATGEAEIVLFRHTGEDWITIGSDHTDRKLEAIGVQYSKQLCGKPIGSAAWALADLRTHWDQLTLRSFAEIDGRRELYQEGKVSSMRAPWELVELYDQSIAGAFKNDSIMFCGTLPAKHGIRWATAFCVELEDPVLNRKMTRAYSIQPLPVEG